MDRLGAVVTSMADACERAGVRSSPATRRWSSAERPTACSSPPRASGLVPEGVDVGPERAPPGRPDPGDRPDRLARRRGDVAPRGDRVRDGRRLRHGAAHRARAGDARGRRRPVPPRRDARRRRERPERARRGERRVDDASTGPTFRSCRPCTAACEMLGLDPLYVANEGVASRSSRPEDAEAVLAAARARSARGAGRRRRRGRRAAGRRRGCGPASARRAR